MYSLLCLKIESDTMTLRNINLKSGTVIFDEFCIDPNLPYETQVDELHQDLLYIRYPQDYAIDIHWLPDRDLNGKFMISIVQDPDWEKPVRMQTTKDFEQLEKYFQEYINLIEELIANSKKKFDILKNINLRSGYVVLYDFNIDHSIPLHLQKNELKENLIQIENGCYVISVSWLPEYNPQGNFVIKLTKKNELTKHYQKTTNSILGLEKIIQDAIDFSTRLNTDYDFKK